MKNSKTMSAKKQIKTNIEQSNELLHELQNYFIPANNIYWCHVLQCCSPNEHKTNIELLEKRFPEFVVNLNTLKDLYFITEKLCGENPKMYTYVNALFLKDYNLLSSKIELSIKSIQEINNYNNIPNLVKTLGILNKALDKVYNCINILEDYQNENENLHKN